MTIDTTGGLDPSSDHFYAVRPEDPQTRESASMWIFDDQGAITLPRLGIEALAEQWNMRDTQVNVCFPDGRAVIVREPFTGGNPVDEDGISRRFTGGGLTFGHPEPFKRLTVS